MKKAKVRILSTLLVILMVFLVPATAYASGTDTIENEVDESNNDRFGGTSPWLSGSQDNSIYGNTIDAGEDEQDISVEKPGRVEKYIAELFRNIGSALISVLQDSIGASIDTIVYGRVGSGQPNKVNIYAFELRKGNPYGVTASVCYALLRGMMFIFLGIYFVFQLAKAAWSGQTAKSRDEIKELMPTMVMKFSALILMPHLLDVALYVRDVLLYGIKEVTGQMITGGATLSLSKAFLLNAERSGTFVDAVMYLGTVVLTIYFVFLYVAVAIDMLVCFVSFPFICVLHSKKRDLVSGWITTVFSNLMTPVIDAVLLLVPLLTSLMLSDVVRGVSVIQLVMCMLIIPARVRFKALLGIQSNERNGFLGAMAVMTFARALAGRIKQGASKIADAVSDAKKGSMHGELADVDREEEAALLSGDGGRKDGKPAQDDNRGLSGEHGGQSETARSSGNMKETVPAGGMERSVPEERSALGSSAEETGAQDDVEAAPLTASYSSGVPSREDVPAGSVNEAVRSIDRQMEDSQKRLDGLRVERAKHVQRDKQIRRQMLDCRRGSEEYRSLEKERADVEAQTAQTDSRIAEESGRLNRLREQSKELHNAAGIRNTPTQFADRRAEILRKRANISNFEQPEFRGVLTNEQMRDLYRKRAISNTAKAVVGTAGAAAAGMAGGSAAIYLGGSGAAMAAAGGMHAGGAAGETAVDVTTEIGRLAAPVMKSAGRSAYQAADMAASAYLMNKIRPAAMQVPVDYAVHPASTTDMTYESPGQNVMASGEVDMGPDRVAWDAASAIQQVVTSQGSPKNSVALRAMQQATLQLEREIAVMKEEGAVAVTQELIREKRIETQTAALSAEILRQMEQKSGYEKGTQAYTDAQNLIREKIHEMLENKNKPLV